MPPRQGQMTVQNFPAVDVAAEMLHRQRAAELLSVLPGEMCRSVCVDVFLIPAYSMIYQ